ncbi:hypothetical protein M5K25_016451 [Dendrobium thyrsiflorum]|uniref:Uncharacterized protein n=1 Tax=Dendrobium thyrsiflorum TaxID=117978 RepID=A0ABD0UJL8_DENTH
MPFGGKTAGQRTRTTSLLAREYLRMDPSNIFDQALALCELKYLSGVAPGSLPTTLGKSAHRRLSGSTRTLKARFYPPRRRRRTGFPSHHAREKRA